MIPIVNLAQFIVVAILANFNSFLYFFYCMEIFGERLKDERKRLGLKQGELAAKAGTTNVAQSRYERGNRSPDLIYLSAVEQAGIDILYVVTGRRDTSSLSTDETDLVRRYRDAPDAVRAAVLAALIAGAASPPCMKDFRGANIGNQVNGNMSGPVSIKMGTARKRKE